MWEPESFYCEKHNRTHRKGSDPYIECLPDYLASQTEEMEMPSETEEAELLPEPVEIASKEVRISSFAEGKLFCKLKDSAPGKITIASGLYKETGQRIFERSEQPFEITELEWSGVLGRKGRFELL